MTNISETKIYFSGVTVGDGYIGSLNLASSFMVKLCSETVRSQATHSILQLVTKRDNLSGILTASLTTKVFQIGTTLKGENLLLKE